MLSSSVIAVRFLCQSYKNTFSVILRSARSKRIVAKDYYQGATAEACKAYDEMRQVVSIQSPHSWTSQGFSFEPYNLLFFPGGHEKSVRQVLDSTVVRRLVAEYFPSITKPSSHCIAAICHGVLAVSESTFQNGKSVLHDVTTTTLPATFEATAYWGTRAWLGDYYKTYGGDSENVEASVWTFLMRPILKLSHRLRRSRSGWMIQSSIKVALDSHRRLLLKHTPIIG